MSYLFITKSFYRFLLALFISLSILLNTILYALPISTLNPNPQLVKDINSTLDVNSNNAYCSSNPIFITVGSHLFYCGQDFTGGRELWISDGTTASTVRLKDIIAGVEGSYPKDLTDVNGILFFTVDDGIHGRELWKSDGTEAGTLLVKDIRNAEIGSNPIKLTNVNGTLFFVASDLSGPRLWKSDGSLAGTVAVTTTTYPNSMNELTNVNGTLFFTAKDANNSNFKLWKSGGSQATTEVITNITNNTSSQLKEFTDVGGILYFTADDGTNGREVWKSDGTSANTVMVQDIRSGSVTSNPTKLTSVNLTTAGATLFFVADDGINGKELWKSNASGTTLLDIQTGAGSSEPDYLTESNGQLLLRATNKLWKSDGTALGTVQVDVGATQEALEPTYIADINGIVYFSAKNGGSNSHEPWKSDGTLAGTALVKDVKPGVAGSFPRFFANANGSIVFIASALNQSKTIMWVSDGTEAGTQELIDMYPETNGSGPKYLTVANDKLFFSAFDGIHGNELWMSDGTETGTNLVSDINPLGSNGISYSNLTEVNDTVFFTATDGTGYKLWKSDGVNTVNVSSDYPYSNTGLGSINNNLYYEAQHPHRGELWSSDGTTAGTQLIKDIRPNDTSGANIQYMTQMNTKAMFVANNGSNIELWVSDGTDAGTFSLNSATTTNSYSSINNLTTVNLTGVGERLFFTAWDITHGVELWISDGTEAGTQLVKDIRASGSSICSSASLTEFNGKLSFCANDGTGNKIWVSDGTAAGTTAVTTTTYPNNPYNLLVVNNELFFSGYDSSNNTARELYKTDGTNAGTVLVKDINPSMNNSFPEHLTNIDGTLYFVADDGTGSTEGHNKKQIWKSDGTTSGTVKITNTDLIYNGTVTELTSFNGALYFVARSREHDFELWKIVDNDFDSVHDEIEHLVKNLTGVNLGDANGDGIKDKNQSHVTSFRNHSDTAWVTVSNSENGNQSAVEVATTPASVPTGFELGFNIFQLDIAVTGTSADIEVFINQDLDITDFMLLGSDNVWDLLSATVTHSGNKTKLAFNIIDGGEYDRDGVVNGVIQLAQGGAVTMIDIDLAITKTIAEVIPGAGNTFTIEIINNGPGDVIGANVSHLLNASFTNASWSCIGVDGASCSATGTGDINDTVSIPTASDNSPKITYTLIVDIDPAATVANDVTSSVAIPAHGFQDTDNSNNTAAHNYSWVPHADLSSTVTLGGTPYIPGTAINFTITIDNQGPSNSVGAALSFNFSELSNISWICTPTVGASCSATGNTTTDTVNIPSGGSLNYAVSAQILPELLGTLDISATATVAAGNVDDVAANNTETTSANLSPQANLGITKADSIDPVDKNEAFSYTLTINNIGPSYAQAVTVEDILPAGLGFVNIIAAGWNCNENTGTVSCTAASLSLGSSTIVINVTAPNNNLPISNTATVASTTQDTQTQNNSATENTSLPNVAPILSGSPITEVLEDAAYSFTPTLTDPDTGDNHVFTVIGKPSWATFDTSTGELSGTPNHADVGISGIISITVDDGADTDTLADFTIEVFDPIMDLDNDGLNNQEEFNHNTNPKDPDSDGDGIGDAYDIANNVSSNLCTGPDEILNTQTILNAETLQCATENSVALESTVIINDGGKLEIISPTVQFDNGFVVPAGGQLNVRSGDPTPGSIPTGP